MKPNLLYPITLGLSLVASFCFAYLLLMTIIGLATGHGSFHTGEWMRFLGYLLFGGAVAIAFYTLWDDGTRLMRVKERQEEILRELRKRS
jgi:hypothetical protein